MPAQFFSSGISCAAYTFSGKTGGTAGLVRFAVQDSRGDGEATETREEVRTDEIQAEIEKETDSEDGKRHLAFLMSVNSVLDLIMGSVSDDIALELSYALDHTIALSLVNKKYDCDLLEEEKKAVSIVKREDYETDDDYARAVEAIDDHWWTISQPQLDMRNANDAIIEMMAKYKLNE